MKKVPLLPKFAKKDTLSSDLLRSEPPSEKVSWTSMLTHIVKVVPLGDHYERLTNVKNPTIKCYFKCDYFLPCLFK